MTVPFNLEALMAYTKEKLGYESYAYWEFFLKDDAHITIQRNVSPSPTLPGTFQSNNRLLGRQLPAAHLPRETRRLVEAHSGPGEASRVRRRKPATWTPVLSYR